MFNVFIVHFVAGIKNVKIGLREVTVRVCPIHRFRACFIRHPEVRDP